MGRHSTYTQEIADEICDRMSLGEPLAQICLDERMPCRRTVYDWCEANPKFAAHIARARDDGHDVIAASCLPIADDGRNDYVEKLAKEGDEKAQAYDAEHVQRSKLRVETRLKLLAKWDKRYAEKVDHTLSAPSGGPVESNVTVTISPQEAYQRMANGSLGA